MQQTITPWLALAQRHLDTALSPSEREHWQHAISDVRNSVEAVDTTPSRAGSPAASSVGCCATRRLWQALIDAEHSGPSVCDAAAHLARAIETHDLGPGTVVSATRIASALETPVQRVRLAIQDLLSARILIRTHTGQTVVPGSRGLIDHPTRIAEWLTLLVDTGVYPAGTLLPPQPALAQSLVSKRSDVRTALRQLHAGKVLACHPGQRPLVRPYRPAPPPPDLHHAITRLRHASTADAGVVDTSAAAVREAARTARTWWAHRANPARDLLTQCRHQFSTAAGHRISQLAATTSADTLVLLRRTAVTALAEWPDVGEDLIWRTACLGADLVQLLSLTEPPEARSAAPSGGPPCM
ncbi:hypothetical protein ACWEQC_39690 [Streptomyces shenzhenensis]